MFLISRDTHPDLTDFLITGLSLWFSRQVYSIDQSFDFTSSLACNTQLLLGWQSLLHGHISLSIINVQQKQYAALSSQHIGYMLTIRLIGKLWNIVHQLCINRNAYLHDSEAIDRVHSIDHLNSAIASELQKGLGNLPTIYAP